jgi:AmiR/NasT family two-component response regulator
MGHLALLAGDVDEHLRGLVVDILHEMGVGLVSDPEAQRPEVVLVVLESHDFGTVLEAAQRHGVPVIVLIAYEDELLIQSVRHNGVESVYPLGRPLAELRGLLARSLPSGVSP